MAGSTPTITLTPEELVEDSTNERLDGFVDDALSNLVTEQRSVVRLLPAALVEQVSDEVLESAAAAANALPRIYAERHQAIVLDRPSPTTFKIGLVNEWNVDTRRALAKLLCTTTQFITFEPLSEEQFNRLVAHAYGSQSAQESTDIAEAREVKDWALTSSQQATASDVEKGAVNYGTGSRVADVTRMIVIDLSNDDEMKSLARQPVEKLKVADLTRLSIWYFIRAKASDWHLEHGIRTGSRIRYRCDGVLHPKFKNMPLDIGRRIGSSLCSMAGVDSSDTQREPKNATITAVISRGSGRPEEIELRFASLPCKPLPEFVLRSQSEVITDIHKLGLLKIHYAQIESALSNTQGIILVTGPTGSGKTNSLASYRTRIEETDNRKVVSMEDPIEIYSDYTSQMAITRHNTWESGFHGMLRFDPNVIIVGELRSKHSVAIALEAATTGHLVFATFHTSNVETTFTRLMKMGVPPEQLADSLIAIQAQRLARTLCRCKKVDEVQSEAMGRTLYRPNGCPACLGIGYKGRTALPELLLVNDEVKDWMACGMSGKEIVQRAASAKWMVLMETVARAKVLAGNTTFTEIDRVAKFTEARSSAQDGRNYEEEERLRQSRYEAERRAWASTTQSSAEENENVIDAEYWGDLHDSPETDDPLEL